MAVSSQLVTARGTLGSTSGIARDRVADNKLLPGSDLNGIDSDDTLLLVSSSNTSSPSSRSLLLLFSTVLLSISFFDSEGKLETFLCDRNPARAFESSTLPSFIIIEDFDSKRLST